MTPENLFSCQVCCSRKAIFALINTMSRARGNAAWLALQPLGPMSPEFESLRHIDVLINTIYTLLIHGKEECPGDEAMALPRGNDGFLDASGLAA